MRQIMKKVKQSCSINTKCVPCSGKMKPLPRQDAEKFLKEIPKWNISENGLSIFRSYICDDFMHAIYIELSIAFMAEREGHHPDLHLTQYKNIQIVLTTFAAKGLTMNDFVLAKMIDSILT